VTGISWTLSDKPLQRAFQVLVRVLEISGPDGIDHATLDMVFEDDPPHMVECRPDGSDLDQHLGARRALFDHPLDGPDVAFETRQAVNDGVVVLVNMGMVAWGYGLCRGSALRLPI
jgi:hypothetical protein